MRLTVIAPDYSFHAALDREEFHTVIPTQKMHQHNTFELIFIIEGEFYQRIEHTIHKYVPGSCCLLNPNVRHIEDYSHNCRFVTLSLSPEFLNSVFSREQDFYFQMERERKETDLTRFISRYFKEPELAGKNYIDFIPQLGTD